MIQFRCNSRYFMCGSMLEDPLKMEFLWSLEVPFWHIPRVLLHPRVLRRNSTVQSGERWQTDRWTNRQTGPIVYPRPLTREGNMLRWGKKSEWKSALTRGTDCSAAHALSCTVNNKLIGMARPWILGYPMLLGTPHLGALLKQVRAKALCYYAEESWSKHISLVQLWLILQT